MISYKILLLCSSEIQDGHHHRTNLTGAYVKINLVHLTGIVLYWNSVKCMFFLMIGFPRWLPQQNIGPLWENKHFMTVIYALILID
jgi:hypothetical protein